MEDPDRPGDHACPHTLVTSIPDGIHKHKHTHNVNRWIEAKQRQPLCLGLASQFMRRLEGLWTTLENWTVSPADVKSRTFVDGAVSVLR